MDQDIRKAIQDAIEWCRERGIPIQNGHWGVAFDNLFGEYKVCRDGVCPLGALLLSNGQKLNLEKFDNIQIQWEHDKMAADVLGVSVEWINAFMAAFDSEYYQPLLPSATSDTVSAYELGHEFRKLYGNG